MVQCIWNQVWRYELRGEGGEMSLRSLESSILAELREVSGNRKIRLKDIMEWRTAEFTPQEGETLYHCPRNGVWCCVRVIK